MPWSPIRGFRHLQSPFGELAHCPLGRMSAIRRSTRVPISSPRQFALSGCPSREGTAVRGQANIGHQPVPPVRHRLRLLGLVVVVTEQLCRIEQTLRDGRDGLVVEVQWRQCLRTFFVNPVPLSRLPESISSVISVHSLENVLAPPHRLQALHRPVLPTTGSLVCRVVAAKSHGGRRGGDDEHHSHYAPIHGALHLNF